MHGAVRFLNKREKNYTPAEGHFKAALLCAELGYSTQAGHPVRAYMELHPDTACSQQVHEKALPWQEKASQQKVLCHGERSV